MQKKNTLPSVLIPNGIYFAYSLSKQQTVEHTWISLNNYNQQMRNFILCWLFMLIRTMQFEKTAIASYRNTKYYGKIELSQSVRWNCSLQPRHKYKCSAECISQKNTIGVHVKHQFIFNQKLRKAHK